MKRRKRIGLLLLITLICGPPLHYLLSPPDDFSLLHQPGIQSTIQLPSNVVRASHGWPADGTVIFLIENAAPQNWPHDLEVAAYDPISGEKRFTHTLPRTLGWRPPVSPDGVFVEVFLGAVVTGKGRGVVVNDALLTMDQKGWEVPIPDSGAEAFQTIWKSDGSGLLKWDSIHQRRVILTDRIGYPPRRYSVPQQNDPLTPLIMFKNGSAILGKSTREGPMFVRAQFDSEVHFEQMDVHFPDGFGVVHADLSPDEHSIVWQVDVFQREFIVSRWIRGILGRSTSVTLKPTWHAVLISKTDGSQMREIGRVKETGDRLRPTSNLWSVRWNRTGDRISFIYNHRFYTLPVKVE